MFKIGQKVVCKNTDALRFGTPTGIYLGKVYTVVGLTYCHDCLREFIEIKEAPFLNKICGECNCRLGTCQSYSSFRFEPLVEEKESNSISIEIDLPVFSLN